MKKHNLQAFSNVGNAEAYEVINRCFTSCKQSNWIYLFQTL